MSATTMFVRSIATKLLCFFRSSWFLPQRKIKFHYCDKVFESAQIYLPTKTNNKKKKKIANGQQIADQYHGIPIQWRFTCTQRQFNRYFELSYPSKFEPQVVGDYLTHVCDSATEIQKQDQIAKTSRGYHFNYMPTFDNLPMDPELKQFLMDDLDQFLEERDFLTEVGEPWRRGYLISGPATGKSLLASAIRYHVGFDDFRFRLSQIYTNEFMQMAIKVSGSDVPIVMTVNIDSTPDDDDDEQEVHTTKSLSDNLLLLDILWSCGGDNKIIILTTDNKGPLDPALLKRRRWMDVHLNLSQGIEKLPMKYDQEDIDLSRLGYPEIEKEIENKNDENEEPEKQKKRKKKKKKPKKKQPKKQNKKNHLIEWMLRMLQLLFKY